VFLVHFFAVKGNGMQEKMQAFIHFEVAQDPCRVEDLFVPVSWQSQLPNE
jgi:hypothetical protein